MKMTENKRYTLFLILMFTASLVLVFVIGAAIKAVPNAVTYTLYTENSINGDVSHTVKSFDECSYDSIYKVTQDGPFKIIAQEKNIFVLSDDVRLYRIKAELSQFPDTDKSAIISGITADSRQKLVEIVEYMES